MHRNKLPLTFASFSAIHSELGRLGGFDLVGFDPGTVNLDLAQSATNVDLETNAKN